MSNTRMRDRIFAGFGAFLFLASACAFTVYVIFQSASSDSEKTPTKSTAQTCQASGTYEKIDAPEPYKPEGTVTELQTTDLVTGSGAAAKNGDCLYMKYYGTLADGTHFDDNYTTDQAFAFTLGGGQVIKGWDEGLVGMKVGGTRRLVIPPSLGYGDQATGSIPANSTLVFEVKLLKIQ